MKKFFKWLLFGSVGFVVLILILGWLVSPKEPTEEQKVQMTLDSLDKAAKDMKIYEEKLRQDSIRKANSPPSHDEIYDAFQSALRESGNPRSMTITPTRDSDTPNDPEAIGANAWEIKKADEIVKRFKLVNREELYIIVRKIGMTR